MNQFRLGEFHACIYVNIDIYLIKFILQVDYLCILVLKNSSYVEVRLSLPSATWGRMNLGPTEKRPEASKQVTAWKARTKGNTASWRACATWAELGTGCTAGACGGMFRRISTSYSFHSFPSAAQTNDLRTKQNNEVIKNKPRGLSQHNKIDYLNTWRIMRSFITFLLTVGIWCIFHCLFV